MTQDAPRSTGRSPVDGSHTYEKHDLAIEFTHQAERLAQLTPQQEDETTGSTQAAEAKWVTPLDPVVETVDGARLPAIPVAEAIKLNHLKDEMEHKQPRNPPRSALRHGKDGTAHGSFTPSTDGSTRQSEKLDAPLGEAVPPSRTNPLFPPLPMYGPPSVLRTLQCWFFRVSSAILSFGFLLAIVAGAIVEAFPRMFKSARALAKLQNPKRLRPFYDEEARRKHERRAAEKAWVQQQRKGTQTPSGEKGPNGEQQLPQDGQFIPTEGGPDPLCIDVGYYARRVGLDAETFDVQTEDGFIIELWHIFNPREYTRPSKEAYRAQPPDLFRTKPSDPSYGEAQRAFREGRKKYPVLMMHGLLQSAGAFCCNDDDSLAFYLAKSGYDVWLGNNRCGFNPKHTSLDYGDPRMWAWNIRQMGVMDLAALTSRVLAQTGFPKLALIAHSQGTTQTFVALAKEQRPEIGEKISVFCALAPAAYAGPLIGKIYFKVMRLVTPSIFRLIFGIHSFIPLMMFAHKVLPARPYSWMGYHVFSFLFSWSDSRWEGGLRDRMFQWAPVYVSAESMRWWLGRECFAKHRCILATKEEGQLEDLEDEEDDEVIRRFYVDREPHVPSRRKLQRNLTSFHCQTLTHQHNDSKRGKLSWYDDQFPPLALWVCGADDLVDGRRLLRRFDRGREPHVRVVHKRIIEGYEHLDVIWAMDAIEKVGKEVREVIWRTAEAESQARCRVPVGCTARGGEVEEKETSDVPMMYSGGRRRMASISQGVSTLRTSVNEDAEGRTQVDFSKDSSEDQERYEERRSEVADSAHSWEDGEKFDEKNEGIDDAVFNRRLSDAHFEDVQEKGNPLEHFI
ncbi:Sterol esterase 2 [Lecanosticta acicola]|uniref:Sterol esterase 2 n=1 Tax=Lecanosticta acicola TaxID=111012 RepID=A0AAI8Z7G0_9PEZI|nr:Sterol esterase 2 [Lecanosticta acicola]